MEALCSYQPRVGFLQKDLVGKIAALARRQPLGCGIALFCKTFRGPVQPRPDILPAALITTPGAR